MSEETAVEAAQADGRDFVTEADVQQAESPDRPEWLPEKYNTGEDLAKAYKELESKQKLSVTGLKLLATINCQKLLTRTWLLITTYSSGGLSIHLRMAIAKKSFRKALKCMPKLLMEHSQI